MAPEENIQREWEYWQAEVKITPNLTPHAAMPVQCLLNLMGELQLLQETISSFALYLDARSTVICTSSVAGASLCGSGLSYQDQVVCMLHHFRYSPFLGPDLLTLLLVPPLLCFSQMLCAKSKLVVLLKKEKCENLC